MEADHRPWKDCFSLETPRWSLDAGGFQPLQCTMCCSRWLCSHWSSPRTAGGGFFATGEVLLILCGALPTLPTHPNMRLGPMQVHGILKFVARLCHCNQDSCMEHLVSLFFFFFGYPLFEQRGGSPVFLCRCFQERKWGPKVQNAKRWLAGVGIRKGRGEASTAAGRF